MVINITYDENPFYIYFKKHYCPKCSNKLSIKYIDQVISKDSPDAKTEDFVLGGIYWFGDSVKRTIMFHCYVCGFEISPTDMKKYEKKK